MPKVKEFYLFFINDRAKRTINFRSLITLVHSTLCIIFKAQPIISDLALRGVGSYPYEPEAQRTRFSILNKRRGYLSGSPRCCNAGVRCFFSAPERKSEQPCQEQGERTADQTGNSLTCIHNRFGIGNLCRRIDFF